MLPNIAFVFVLACGLTTLNPVLKEVLHITGWSLSWKSAKNQGKMKKVEMVSEKSGNFYSLSKLKSSTTPQVQT